MTGKQFSAVAALAVTALAICGYQTIAYAAGTTLSGPVTILADPANPGVLRLDFDASKACTGATSTVGRVVVCSNGQGGLTLSTNGGTPVPLGASLVGPTGPVGPQGP